MSHFAASQFAVFHLAALRFPQHIKTLLTLSCLALAHLLGASGAHAADSPDPEQADAIHELAEVEGGLVVHVGCGDGRLTAALRRSPAYVVHGLESEKQQVDAARDFAKSLGDYGATSFDHWKGPLLPYVDNSVNLIVVEDPESVPQAEIQRVLVPGGTAVTRQGTVWSKTTKGAREGVDEWTHFAHDASGNPVAHDSVVGPPRHLQWTTGPRHSRSHEYTPSIHAVVSTGGRMFYIADRGSVATLRAPSDWRLMARDAYNGILLWERPVGKWFSRLYGWTRGPGQLQRKLVAVDDRVYVTLGFHAPLTEFDAATGEEIRVHADTEGTEEILCHDGVLLLVVREVTEERLAAYQALQDLTAQADSPLQQRDTRTPLTNVFRSIENKAARTILAIDCETGKQLWKKSGASTMGLKPLSLRACGGHVYCEKRGSVFCFDLKSGETAWSVRSDSLRAVSADALVCVSKNKITLRSPDTGESRWTQPVSLAQVRDVLLVGNSLWMGGGRPYDSGNAKYTGPLWGPYFAVERELATGEVVQEITAENPKHHHRCYDNKATERYILGGRRGTEFLDLESGDYLWHSWARGTCRYGVMPCNGMIYVPPHACGCYITVKLMGFNALAPDRGTAVSSSIAHEPPLLEKGPAYALRPTPTAAMPADWPTFRGDPSRSGRAAGSIKLPLTLKWESELGGPLTAPIVASGKVLVARPDQHELLAVHAASGDTAWTYTTSGRIDSPPTYYDGQFLVGCRDGHVYNLTADDGALRWRFRAARTGQRIVANGQLESVAPVHGSVLLGNGAVAFTAGRSSFLDGGLELFRLAPTTGELLSRTEIYSPDPETGEQPEQYGPNSMPGARSDILASDGQHIYLRDMTFNTHGEEVSQKQSHLFALTDFLDDSWTHRSYWIYGTKSSIATGCSGQDRKLLYGRVLVFDDTTVFGYGRERVHWSNEFEDGEYRLFARQLTEDKPHWTKSTPVQVQAMVLAGDIVFAAGSGAAPSADPSQHEVSPTPLLLAYSAADGSELGRTPLPAAPILNGMAAADGALVLSLENGQLIYLQGQSTD